MYAGSSLLKFSVDLITLTVCAHACVCVYVVVLDIFALWLINNRPEKNKPTAENSSESFLVDTDTNTSPTFKCQI